MILVSIRVIDLVEWKESLPGHGVAYTREDCGKLLDQVWSISSLFQLLDHTNDDIIMNTFCINFVVC